MANLRIMLRLAVVVTMAAYCAALPVQDSRPDVIEIIAPRQTAQETLDSLNFGDPNSEMSERNKRTIGILRQLFPSLSQIIDRKVEELVRYIIPIAGRVLLSGGGLTALLGGGGGGGASGSSSSDDDTKVSINLGGDDDDDDDDSEEDDSNTASDTASVASRFKAEDADSTTQRDNGVQASNLEASSDRSSDLSSTSVFSETAEPFSGPAALPSTESPDPELSSTESISSSTETSAIELTPDTQETPSSTEPSSATSAPEPLSTSLAATAAVADDENQLAEAESQNSEVRVQFTDPDVQSKAAEGKEESADQEGAASNGAAVDDLSLDDGDVSDENRDKRFLSFGLGDTSGAGSSGGSGGGSGNFLFDIIRRPAESVARAAGQAFRILTGTDSIGLGITASHTAVRDIPLQNATKLVAGSGGTEQSDEAANAPADSGEKADGLTEGIPGPVTRLFIIANRGISNLIQDLILRLAQTSERIVNFKARLITSII